MKVRCRHNYIHMLDNTYWVPEYQVVKVEVSIQMKIFKIMAIALIQKCCYYDV